MITSAADAPSSCLSTGMPLPLSATDTDPSFPITTSIWSQNPANPSSIELSNTSNTMWCSPVPSSVSPIYIPGRFFTASSPLRTFILSES